MNLPYLAQRIREFRKKRMLTLEQLAERAQLTQSVLSKVENSRVTPSLAALGRIAQALGVSLSELLAGVDDERRMTVVRAGERPLYERDNRNGPEIYRSLAPTRRAKKMEPLVLEMPPGSPRHELPSQRAEKFLLVIKGKVEIECGDEQCRLGAGDAVYLDACEKPSIANLGNSSAEILYLLSGGDAISPAVNDVT